MEYICGVLLIIVVVVVILAIWANSPDKALIEKWRGNKVYEDALFHAIEMIKKVRTEAENTVRYRNDRGEKESCGYECKFSICRRYISIDTKSLSRESGIAHWGYSLDNDVSDFSEGDRRAFIGALVNDLRDEFPEEIFLTGKQETRWDVFFYVTVNLDKYVTFKDKNKFFD